MYAEVLREAALRLVRPVAGLVAVDDRVFAYRHPLPTDRTLGKYAMLVLGG